MAMRVTKRSGRQGSARHNDRSFLRGDNGELAPHIDRERTAENTVAGMKGYDTLEEAELAFYQKRYSAALEATNERYLAQRHPEKCRTIEDMYYSKKTCPQETILQIGGKCESVTAEQLKEIHRDYLGKINEWNQAHGNHMRLISISVHTDEATPHIHQRQVYESRDAAGNPVLKQNQALKDAGIPLPDPSKPEGRYNNRMMTVEQAHRQLWIDTCREHGLEIESEPRPSRRHLDVAEYKEQQLQKEIEGLQNKQLQERIQLQELQEQQQAARAELAQAEKFKAQKKQLEHDVKALETDKGILTGTDVRNMQNKHKKSLLKDEVRLPVADYQRLINTAGVADTARKQAKDVTKQRDNIIVGAKKAAQSIIDGAQQQADAILQPSLPEKIKRIKQDEELIRCKRILSHPAVKVVADKVEKEIKRAMSIDSRSDRER